MAECKLLNVLMVAGANIEAVDLDEQNALSLASRFGHLEVVEMLLAAGADGQKNTVISGSSFWKRA